MTSDGERDAWRLQVHEHPLLVEARSGPPGAGVVARPNGAEDLAARLEDGVDARDLSLVQIHAIFGEHERAAALSQAAHTLNVVATVFTQHDAATRAHGNVVRIVTFGVAEAVA